MIKSFTLLSLLAVLPLLTFLSTDVYANNLAIQNVELVDQDTTADTIKVQFDISWENGWADITNMDGAWIVLRISDGTTNKAGTLRTAGLNPDGQVGTQQSGSAFARLDVVVPDDRKGAFIVPGLFNTGTVDFHDAYVTWHYGEDGYADAAVSAGSFNLTVVGVEVVYIHNVAFTAGNDGTGTTASFKQNWTTTDSNLAPTVSSEDMISFRGNTAGSQYWYYQTASNTNESAAGSTFDLPKAFPKGFQGFFMMKTEISQGSYNTFYNALTTNQKASRNAGAGSSVYKPVRTIDWFDLCAYCDWMALRPMTELEFEKAARGPTAELAGEFAWGSTSKTNCAALTNSGLINETCSTGSAQATFGGSLTNGTRVGLYATASTTTRAGSGAGYWGNLDLTGNVNEMVVSVGNATGRLFAGTHGDGTLTTLTSYEGNATNSDWPGWDISNPTRGIDNGNTLQGSGIRGGSWSDTTDARGWISDRNGAANYTTTATTSSSNGGRCVRTAPTLFVSYFEDRN